MFYYCNITRGKISGIQIPDTIADQTLSDFLDDTGIAISMSPQWFENRNYYVISVLITLKIYSNCLSNLIKI